MVQNRFQNGFKNWFVYPKLMSKSIPHGGSGASFWGVGWSFWANFGGLGGSGSQVRLGRRFGRLLDDFKSQDGSNLRPKMAPSWSQNGIKNFAKIESFFDAFENQIVMGF